MINTVLQYFNVALAVCFVISAIFAARKGMFKDNAAVQEQTINALTARIATLEKQAESDTQKIAQLRQLISTIRHALKRRGLHIEIENGFVTLIDANGQSQSTQVPNIAKVRPVKLTPPIGDDDDDAV